MVCTAPCAGCSTCRVAPCCRVSTIHLSVRCDVSPPWRAAEALATPVMAVSALFWCMCIFLCSLLVFLLLVVVVLLLLVHVLQRFILLLKFISCTTVHPLDELAVPPASVALNIICVFVASSFVFFFISTCGCTSINPFSVLLFSFFSFLFFSGPFFLSFLHSFVFLFLQKLPSRFLFKLLISSPLLFVVLLGSSFPYPPPPLSLFFSLSLQRTKTAVAYAETDEDLEVALGERAPQGTNSKQIGIEEEEGRK